MNSWLNRKFERHSVNLKVGLDADAPIRDKGRILSTHDISPAGAFVITDEPLGIGTKVFLRIILPSGVRTVVHGMVWRSVSHGIAIRFEHFCEQIINEFGNGYAAKDNVVFAFPSKASG